MKTFYRLANLIYSKSLFLGHLREEQMGEMLERGIAPCPCCGKPNFDCLCRSHCIRNDQMQANVESAR